MAQRVWDAPATIPQHQAVVAGCWGSLEGTGGTRVKLSAGRSPQGDVRTQPHAHHTLGTAGWGCWGTLVSPPRCSPAPRLRLPAPPAVPAPCHVPTATTGQGGVTEPAPCPGGASPTHSRDTVFCMEHPLCSPYRDDLPPVAPLPWELGGGPVGAVVRGRPPQRDGSRAAAGRRPPRLLRVGIELLCLEPVRH